MKFERERDISAFHGKSWRARMVLRKEAELRDSSIILFEWVSIAVAMFVIFPSAEWAMRHIAPQSSFLARSAVSVVPICVALALFRGLFIVPRIRRALKGANL
jgi:hypothetical protein